MAPATEPAFNWFCQNTSINTSTSAIQLDNMFDQITLSTLKPGSLQNNYYAAYPLQIRWKEGDFGSVKTTTSSTTPTSSLAPAQSWGSGRPTSTSVSGVQMHDSRALPTGAIAAIAVVAGVVALSALGVLVWWLRRTSKGRHSSELGSKGEGTGEMAVEGERGEIGNTHNELEAKKTQREAELVSRERLEMEAREMAELGQGKRSSFAEMG